MEIQNIALWAKLNKYSVDEAACLVCDQEPGTVGENDPYYGIARSMKDQLEADGCCATVNTDYISNTDWRGVPTGTKRALNSKKIVTRERLKVWCAANDHRPKVFFPDEQIKPDELNSKSRDHLLRTIGALALLLIEKTAGEKFGDRSKPNKNAIFKEIDSLLVQMGSSTEGQGKSKLHDVLKEAIELAMEK